MLVSIDLKGANDDDFVPIFLHQTPRPGSSISETTNLRIPDRSIDLLSIFIRSQAHQAGREQRHQSHLPLTRFTPNHRLHPLSRTDITTPTPVSKALQNATKSTVYTWQIKSSKETLSTKSLTISLPPKALSSQSPVPVTPKTTQQA